MSLSILMLNGPSALVSLLLLLSLVSNLVALSPNSLILLVGYTLVTALITSARCVETLKTR